MNSPKKLEHTALGITLRRLRISILDAARSGPEKPGINQEY